MTIRELRFDDAAVVTDLYMEASRLKAERDPDSGMPSWERINRWVVRTLDSDDAVCLVADTDNGVIGYLLASISRHPAMPGVLGRHEELYARDEGIRRQLVEVGIAWMRERGAGPIQATVSVAAPWTNEEVGFWRALGFKDDRAVLTRYS